MKGVKKDHEHQNKISFFSHFPLELILFYAMYTAYYTGGATGCRVVGIAGLVLLLPLLWEVLKEGIKSEVNEK